MYTTAFRPVATEVSFSHTPDLDHITNTSTALHFKLAMANEKSLEEDEEAQCTYIPQLDPDRDQDLKRILESCNAYLVDEISFASYEVGKFYARVMRALTEKVVD